MFRKIVSNLSFSPALVGQLSFYAKRLRKEEMTRRVGLVFVVLALIIQSLAVFQAPESANAANSSDMVYGGLGLGSSRSINNFLAPYDSNVNNLKDIMNYVGITREEIAATQFGYWMTDGNYSMGLTSSVPPAQENVINITNAAGQSVRTVYMHDMTIRNGSTNIWGYGGYSAKAGNFLLMQACGNLVMPKIPPPPPPPPSPVSSCTGLTIQKISRTKYILNGTANAGNGATISKYTFKITDSTNKVVTTQAVAATGSSAKTSTIDVTTVGTYNATLVVTTSLGDKTGTACTTKFSVAPPDKCPVHPPITVEDKDCQPCPDNPSVWIKDESCAAKIIKNKSAMNLTQNANATSVVAKPGDRIQYTVTIENTGLIEAKNIALQEPLQDVLEYATLIDNGGGTLNETTKILSWPNISLKAKAKETRTFVVKVLDTIPATAKGSSEPSSYDCLMTNIFGNAVEIRVNCPTPKVVEQVVTQLPKTGPTENMIFAGIILAIATYFYARTRQVKKEVRLIRRNVSAGTI